MKVNVNPIERHIIRMALRTYKVRMKQWTEETPKTAQESNIWRENAHIAGELVKKFGG
jgi:hypothetical protein